MSCHDLNEQNEAGDYEVDDYKEESEEPEYVSKECRQFEKHLKLNLEEMKKVNLEDPEWVKEVKINIHFNETQRKGIILFLSKYIDVLVWEVGDMQELSTDVVSRKLPINLGFNPMKQKAQKFNLELSLNIK